MTVQTTTPRRTITGETRSAAYETTRAAVRRFESHAGLINDGINAAVGLGPDVLDALASMGGRSATAHLHAENREAAYDVARAYSALFEVPYGAENLTSPEYVGGDAPVYWMWLHHSTGRLMVTFPA